MGWQVDEKVLWDPYWGRAGAGSLRVPAVVERVKGQRVLIRAPMGQPGAWRLVERWVSPASLGAREAHVPLVDGDTLFGWLRPADALPLECDGLTRVLSALLRREGIAHDSMAGQLLVQGVGTIPLHHWIRLQDGRVIDFRARMWLGKGSPSVPHGIFTPAGVHAYEGKAVDFAADPRDGVICHFLLGVPLSAYLPLQYELLDRPGEV